MDKQELLKELKQEGFSKKILDAFAKIKREDFIPEELKEAAYENQPLPIGKGATISQPYTIAFMLELLELSDDLKILEIGSGSGYVLALMNELARNSEIYGIEINKKVAQKSRNVLKDFKNIKIITGNGFLGLKKYAPYERILISAAAEKMPEHLYSRLEEDGILVCPVKNSIFKIWKENGRIKTNESPGFVFVPLVGEE